MNVPTNPRIGVLHAPGGAATLADIASAAKNVCEPVLLLPFDIAQRHPDFALIAARLFETVTVSARVTDEDLAGLKLSGLTTMNDVSVDQCDAITRGNSWAGAPSVVGAWDKLVQRAVTSAAGLSRLMFAEVNSPDELLSAWQRIGTPAVLKPRRANSSAGLAVLITDDDVTYQMATRKNWQGLILEQRILPAPHPGLAGVLAGYVSVETVSDADRHHHVAVIDKYPLQYRAREGRDGADSLLESDAIYPTRLPPDYAEEVIQFTHSCLDALGIRQRVTHTEVFLTRNGPELIEVNGRPAGYLSAMMARDGHQNLFRDALLLAAGNAVQVKPVPHDAAPTALVMPLFPARHGVVRSHVTPRRILEIPGVDRVDHVAQYGAERSETGFRMCVATIRAETFNELQVVREGVARRIRGCFASDLGNDAEMIAPIGREEEHEACTRQ
jgi:hypothetical protein